MKHDRQTLAFQNESVHNPLSSSMAPVEASPSSNCLALQPFASPSAESQSQVCQAHGGKSVKSMNYVFFGEEEETSGK